MLFWVLAACLTTPTKYSTINLKETLIFNLCQISKKVMQIPSNTDTWMYGQTSMNFIFPAKAGGPKKNFFFKMIKTQKQQEQLDRIKLLHWQHSCTVGYYTINYNKIIEQENNYEPD